ncbi:hypothetical protein E9993_13180 [Labilibacter sediminis]|nr:hypothetical protein E9993_13180 [Labilibacter sediminis]
MHKILVLFLLLILISFKNPGLNAQPYQPEELKLWQIKGYAKSAIQQSDYHSAIFFYNYLAKKYPKNKKYAWELASLNLKSRNYQNAYEQYKKLAIEDKKKSSLASFYAATTAMSLGYYDEAYEIFKDLKRTKQTYWLPKNFKEKVKIQIQGCEFAKNIKDSTISIDISLLNNSINKPHIEFNPFYISDSVFIYSSSNIDSVKYYDSEDRKPKRKFYKAHKSDTIWKREKIVEEPFFNHPDFDTGDGIFSLDNKRFYFTQCSKNWMQKMVCHLYVTSKNSDKWTTPQPLSSEINIPNYSATQPAIGTCYDPKLEVIYFVSDRPGGYGGTDIWFTIYDTQKETYQKPINAGIYLNTDEDETTPFYDTFGHCIYYSSNGLPGLGGLDVYYSQGDMLNWNEPVNLGMPINSECDDLYYSEHKLGNKGFFTSNREGGYALTHPNCCDDIYHWEKSEIEKVWIKGKLKTHEYTFNNLISSDQNNVDNLISRLDSARINLYLKKDTSNLIFLAHETTNEKGEFSFLVPKGFDFEVMIDDSRVLNKKLSFSTQRVHSKELNMELKPITVKTINKAPIILSNIYYEFDNDQLTDESKTVIKGTLLKLMLQYTDLLVEISSHTDNKGNERYNKRLSQNRADNVVAFLISEGVEEFRLKARGFGETQPIANNVNPDGSDNPEGRALNRRTEFRLIDDNEMRN